MASWPGRRRAARVVVFDPAGRILLISARNPAAAGGGHWWEIPGGGIDRGESSEQAAERELWEEAGIRDAQLGPVVWTQSVEFSFGGMRFDQDEWIHVATCDGTTNPPGGLEFLEAAAFGEQRWWSPDELCASGERTIPYRLAEFLPDLVEHGAPSEPIDITPSTRQVRDWNRS
ncbi:MAG: NUDIX hydrolase [Microthrixaceae bacterium]